jgi:hypothetical protein
MAMCASLEQPAMGALLHPILPGRRLFFLIKSLSRETSATEKRSLRQQSPFHCIAPPFVREFLRSHCLVWTVDSPSTFTRNRHEEHEIAVSETIRASLALNTTKGRLSVTGRRKRFGEQRRARQCGLRREDQMPHSRYDVSLHERPRFLRLPNGFEVPQQRALSM